MIRLRFFFFLLIVPGVITAQPAGGRLERGIHSFHSEDFPDAIRHLRFYTRTFKGRNDPEGFYYLSKAYWSLEPKKAKEASAAILHALRKAPDEPRFIEMRLRQLLSYHPFFEPRVSYLREVDRMAKRMLELDSTSHIGHYAKGIMAFDQYAPHAHVTGKVREVLELQREAFGELGKAVRLGCSDWVCFEPLLRVMAESGRVDELGREYVGMAQRLFPENQTEIALYSALADYFAGNLDDFSSAISLALNLLDEDDRRPFLEYSFHSESSDTLNARPLDWTDPILLTPVNEREVEHQARVAYAYLSGWLGSQMGEVLVRYGFPGQGMPTRPDAAGQYNAQTRRLSELGAGSGNGFDTVLWQYPDMRFGFLAHPFQKPTTSFYSPSARAFADAGAGGRDALAAGDYTLTGPATFRRIPSRTQSIPTDRSRIPVKMVPFRGKDGRTDIWAIAGVPLGDSTFTETTPNTYSFTRGFFLTNSSETQKRVLRNQTKSEMISVSLPDQRLWIDTEIFTADPEVTTLQYEMTDKENVLVVSESGEHKLDDYEIGRFDISGLLTGYHMEELSEGSAFPARRDVGIVAAPWGVFGRDQPVYVYVEVYDVSEDSLGEYSYTLEASLTPVSNAGRLRSLTNRIRGIRETGVSVTFASKSPTPDDGRYFILDTTNQPAGEYVLTVIVTDSVTAETRQRTETLYLQ